MGYYQPRRPSALQCDILLAVNGEASHAGEYQSVVAGRGFRLFVGRERHLRWYALLTVSRGGVTTAPIPRRVIASGLVKRDALPTGQPVVRYSRKR